MLDSEPINKPDDGNGQEATSPAAPVSTPFDLVMAYRALIAAYIRSDSDADLDTQDRPDNGDVQPPNNS